MKNKATASTHGGAAGQGEPKRSLQKL